MMTIGELHDKLTAIKEAEDGIEEARKAIGFGGNPDTMLRKHEHLVRCEEYLQTLRDEELQGVTK